MVKMLPVMKNIQARFNPTYSYARAYKKGDELKDIKIDLVVKYLQH